MSSTQTDLHSKLLEWQLELLGETNVLKVNLQYPWFSKHNFDEIKVDEHIFSGNNNFFVENFLFLWKNKTKTRVIIPYSLKVANLPLIYIEMLSYLITSIMA